MLFWSFACVNNFFAYWTFGSEKELEGGFKNDNAKIMEKCRVCMKRNTCNLEDCALEEFPSAFYRDSD